jgi:hypothetical protein
MREIRPSGSEGVVEQANAPSLPLFSGTSDKRTDLFRSLSNAACHPACTRAVSGTGRDASLILTWEVASCVD